MKNHLNIQIKIPKSKKKIPAKSKMTWYQF